MIFPIQKKGIQTPPQYNENMDSFMFGRHHLSTPPNRLPTVTKIPGSLPTNILASPKITKGIGGFAKSLDNLQQVLRMVETTTPFIREYGPMIKNLPAMYRMMKAFKDIEKEPEEKDVHVEKEESKKVIISPEIDPKSQNIPPKSKGLSKPKLYI